MRSLPPTTRLSRSRLGHRLCLTLSNLRIVLLTGVLVAGDADDQPIAYGDVERDGRLDHLYCSPVVAGCGVAKRLYEELELAARRVGVSVIYVEASEPVRNKLRSTAWRCQLSHEQQAG